MIFKGITESGIFHLVNDLDHLDKTKLENCLTTCNLTTAVVDKFSTVHSG